ncbi:hypothetical protein FA95DRAFT_1577119 [Auriscalpium vulgare]|uniref:Uncharacterized protein n=1 Tax=Auriscalpium vulgare TaxID=40419 RepID=A0ACB8R8T3_9AGAM|nr:hypothetical protein FA95DRAFT_1577119 [Auriscalpium vulgare]
MPNSLSHIILTVDVENGPIVVNVLLYPNGTANCTWAHAPPDGPSESTPGPRATPMQAGGPPVVRTVNISLKVPGNANRGSHVDMRETVELVAAARAFFAAMRREQARASD